MTTRLTQLTDALERVEEARRAVESTPPLVGQTPDQQADMAAAAGSYRRALTALVKADRHLRSARALLSHAKASEPPQPNILAG